MTVAELIKALQRLPADLPILSTDLEIVEDVYQHTVIASGEPVVIIQFVEDK